jgi:hypothetical protein
MRHGTASWLKERCEGQSAPERTLESRKAREATGLAPSGLLEYF